MFPDVNIQGKGRQHRDEQRNLHFFAPEYGGKFCVWTSEIFTLFKTIILNVLKEKLFLINKIYKLFFFYFIVFSFPLAGEDDYAIDIFSFGICALEVREPGGGQKKSICGQVHVWALTCIKNNYFFTPRWQYLRSRPTVIQRCPRRPSSTQVNLWKTLWWE